MTDLDDEAELTFLGPQPLCPGCLSPHRPASPCYAGPSRVEPALYAEAAVCHELELVWGDLSHAEVSRIEGLSDVIREVRARTRRPSEDLLCAIGFERVVFYRRKA